MKLYFGLDGDSIGRRVESFLITNNVEDLKAFSKKIVIALDEIRELVENNNGEIIFCTGDSILFYGNFEKEFGDEILNIFRNYTSCTASVGVGNNITKTYLGLKLAKSRGGNQSIYFENL